MGFLQVSPPFFSFPSDKRQRGVICSQPGDNFQIQIQVIYNKEHGSRKKEAQNREIRLKPLHFPSEKGILYGIRKIFSYVFSDVFHPVFKQGEAIHLQTKRVPAARKKKKKFVPGGPVAVPAVCVALASLALVACLTVLAVDPPELPGFFFIDQVFGGSSGSYADSDDSESIPVQQTLLQQTVPADDAYMDSICYLGDSITYGLGVYSFTDPSSTFGYVGLTQDTAGYKQFINLGQSRLLTMEEAVARLKPKRMILLIGINALGWMDESTFFSTYHELVQRLQAASPDSLLIIESILPVTKYYEQYVDSRINNAKIDRYNKQLQSNAEKWGCYFLNSAEVFKATDGTADINYMNGDGMHLNKNGYQLMLNYIRSHAVSRKAK